MDKRLRKYGVEEKISQKKPYESASVGMCKIGSY